MISSSNSLGVTGSITTDHQRSLTPSFDSAVVNQSSVDEQHEKLNKKNCDSTSRNDKKIDHFSDNYYFQEFKAFLHGRVVAEKDFVRSFQRFFGVVSKDETSRFWYYVFRLSSELGNESMFASFLPFIFWHIDKHLGLEILLIWAIVSGVGQYIKEIFQLPRPDLDTKLESCYESEFGFPSTHASGSLTLSITFFGYFLNNYNIESVFLSWMFKIGIGAWIIMCCMSRLYLGVHSPIDIYGGLIYGSILVFLFSNLFYCIQPYLVIETFSVPLLIFLASVAFMWFYKTSLNSLTEWRSSYGDTGRIFGAYTGAWLGTWLVNYQFKPDYLYAKLSGANIELPTLNLLNLTLGDWAFIIWTSAIGIVCVLLSKEIAKRVCYFLMKIFYLSPKDSQKDMKTIMHSRYDVEVPVIFMAYTVIGLTSAYFVPVFVIGKL